MIDLYVIQPEDKEGVRVNLFDATFISETVSDIIKLLSKKHIEFVKIDIIGHANSDPAMKQIEITYANGSYIKIILEHDDIVFVDENQVFKCQEEELESRFGLTTNHRRIERD